MRNKGERKGIKNERRTNEFVLIILETEDLCLQSFSVLQDRR